jgi:hypothetical protein
MKEMASSGSSGLPGYRLVVSSCGHGNKPLCYVKRWDFLEWLSDCWFHKKDLTAWSYLIADMFYPLHFKEQHDIVLMRS